METQVDFSNIEVLAEITGTKIDTREICSKWLLLTYDLPHNETGDKARREFLASARTIGATKHTDSVYLMPWTQYAEHLALELARHGDVCVWTSAPTEESRAAEITESYDRALRPQIGELDDRIDRIEGHLREKRYKRAHKMIEKTEKMVSALEQAIIRRGSAELYILVSILKKRLELVD